MLNIIRKSGQYLQYTGQFFVLAMAVVGTVAIDLVILAALLKDSERQSRRGNNDNHFFFTMLVWQMMFSNHNNRSTDYDFALRLVLSPITTLIAIGLSLALGVPLVGLGLALSWCVALGTIALGFAIEKWADMAIEYFSRRFSPASVDEEQVHTTSFGRFPIPSAPPEHVVVHEVNESNVVHAVNVRLYDEPISLLSSIGLFSDSVDTGNVLPSAPPLPDYW